MTEAEVRHLLACVSDRDERAFSMLYREFASIFAADARNAEAKFRLARAYQARGEYELSSDRDRGKNRGAVGR